MTRLAACTLLLIFAMGNTGTCWAADAADGTDEVVLTISVTKSDGADAIVIDGPRSTIIVKSVTLHDGDKTITLTPCSNGMEMRLGGNVVRTTELRFREMPSFKALEVLSVKLKPARLTPDNRPKTRVGTFLQIAKDVIATGNCRVV